MNDPTLPEPSSSTPASPDMGAVPPADAPIVVPPPGPEYEFSAAQNEVFDSLTRGIIWVRLPLFVVGIFQVIFAVALAFRLRQDGAHIVGILGHVLTAVVCFLLAGWLLRAASAFSRVTHTSGRDITNLMIGIRNLAVWFDLLAFFVKLYLALLAILMILMMVGLFGGAFRGS